MGFGNTVRQHRIALGISLPDLATKIGISVPHLSRLERELIRPTPTLVEAIARHLSSPDLRPDIQGWPDDPVAVPSTSIAMYRRYSTHGGAR
jgi:transcriptional regulator with XRE-family HTH domain